MSYPGSRLETRRARQDRREPGQGGAAHTPGPCW
jgi:hypothetical protein